MITLMHLFTIFTDGRPPIVLTRTLFVTFLIGKYGNDAVRFIKVVGTCSGEKSLKSGKMEDDIEEAYRNVKWYHFLNGKEVDFWTYQISMNGAAAGFQVTALFDYFGA